ncbi:MAG: FliA/WhiG family RNA polymerase sigma factor [bacterium]
MIEDNLSLVHFVAKKLGRSMSTEVDLDELVNIGTLGLIAAAESFDARRGLAFSTYAVPRIRGAILDELRRQDHVPRSIRRKTREMAQAREVLMHANGRPAYDGELAARLGIDIETLWRWQADVERTVHLSLDTGADTGDHRARSPLDVLRAPGTTADERLEHEERVTALGAAMLRLKPQQRTVLSLHYFEELTAREIALVLGISESRVSQVRSKALEALRDLMQPLQASA